mmetsp:Transcript_2090/g.7584  ORF Transcript_2090/g.7584 Transcript_2090/m.7584 type:complete len:216 (-) Transcript_2090:89-736(-)
MSVNRRSGSGWSRENATKSAFDKAPPSSLVALLMISSAMSCMAGPVASRSVTAASCTARSLPTSSFSCLREACTIALLDSADLASTRSTSSRLTNPVPAMSYTLKTSPASLRMEPRTSTEMPVRNSMTSTRPSLFSSNIKNRLRAMSRASALSENSVATPSCLERSTCATSTMCPSSPMRSMACWKVLRSMGLHPLFTSFTASKSTNTSSCDSLL